MKFKPSFEKDGIEGKIPKPIIRTNTDAIKCICVFLLFCHLPLSAQITVNGGLSATDIIGILQGNDIVITNETVNCPNDAYGSYNNATIIGLTEGALFTSGTINNALGPNAAAGTSTNNAVPGDPLIDAITGVNTFDACILEFDFIPVGNTFVFNYVFGSEEYFEYVCSGFNDGFGFFLSGPNPAGGTYTDENVALLPNGTPVSINSVNNGNPLGSNCTNNQGDNCPCNSEYYIDNTGGTDLEYDGYTTVLNVSAEVVPCETYNIKIAIADGGDGAFDSGIFIENFSISSINDFTANALPAFEGCNNGEVNFDITNPLPYDLNLSLNVLPNSTASSSDYASFPSTLTIPTGDNDVSFSYAAIFDNLEECTETILLEYSYNLNCGLLVDTIVLEIKESIAIECPPEISLACNETLPPPNPSLVTILNDCSDIGNVTIVHLSDVSNNASGCNADLKTITRTYRASDVCGNTKNCTQIFTFTTDLDSPNINTSLSNQIGLSCGTTVPPPYTNINDFNAAGGNVTDNCSNINIESVDIDNGNNGCNGNIKIITRTYTFTDDCGNTNSFDQTFSYELDEQVPTINCPADITGLACDANIPPAYKNIEQFIANGGEVADNCSSNTEMSISYTDVDSGVNPCNNPSRTITRTYTLTDACGNQNQCSQEILFAPDVLSPVITCLPDISSLACNDVVPPPIETIASFIASGGTIDDNCSSNSEMSITSNDVNNNQTGCVGNEHIITRTYTISDACNNSTQCTQQIFFDSDIIPPTVICPPDETLTSEQLIPPPFSDATDFTNAGGVIGDNCSKTNELNIIFLGTSLTGSGCAGDPFVISYQYEIEDLCGNKNSCSQAFKFVEDGPLILTCPSEINIDCIENLSVPFSTLQELINAGGEIEDNCGVESFILLNETIE